MNKPSLSLLMATVVFAADATRTSVSDNNDYPPYCKMASLDPKLFANFRQSPECRRIVETVGGYEGQEYLRLIKEQTPLFLNYFTQFKKSDQVGNPVMVPYDEIGFIAPTTLRYIKVASDLLNMHGSLDGLTIVEIGGGYGGQCKIIHDLFKYKQYIIVDLPGPLALARKFLQAHGINNVIYLAPNDPLPTNEIDLVISNYAYSELTSASRQKYINTILRFAKRGYLTCNVAGTSQFASKQELLNELTQSNIPWVEAPERPLTDPNNYMAIWTR